jgi:hypothetical protein
MQTIVVNFCNCLYIFYTLILNYFGTRYKRFLIRIANSLGMFFIWMIVNVTVGIKWGYAFWGNHFTKGNLIFLFGL